MDTEGRDILRAVSPASGKDLGEVPATSPQEVKEIVGQARKVAPEWASIAPSGRVHLLKEVRHRIYDNLDDIIEVVSDQCGKPRAEALAHDVLPTVLMLQYYERMAPRWLRPQRVGPIAGPLLGAASKVEYRPFGVVGCISPWNYPFFLSFLGIAPALFAGNAIVLKPSEVTPGVGELLRRVLEPLSPGVATVIQGGGEVGAALVDAPVDKLCFIGSPSTGRKIAEAAAKHLTPVVMELGGQDAAIVCDDADLDVASSGVLWAAFMNAGQTCAAIERAYVVDSVADRFEELVVDKVAKLRQDSAGDVGSLTSERQLHTVNRHIGDALDKGARLLAGGPGSGKTNADGTLWASPTVVEGRSEDMAIATEETFGPLLPIVRVRDEEEAIRRVNEEGFNLTSSVWTRDRRRALAIASRLRAGTVVVNGHGDTAGAPWTPWGGVGESGYGRLNGIYGLREFVMPVNVSTSLAPGMKKLWWYPYGDATTTTLRSFTELLSARTMPQRATALKSVLSNVGRALKEKL
jgi:acyl-CoA reductase-like NAD-dependent aldehyde dehydrogenase